MLAFVLGEDSGFFFFLEVVWDTPKKKKKKSPVNKPII